jgi:RHS repeat-associated protein
MGWTIGLPSITRKTDKGLPTYDDAGERDVFLLSGAEDLVPFLDADGNPERPPPRTVGTHDYVIVRYRPRIEGLHARIERWTREDGDIHWRSISRDNVTTLYGRDDNSRISDPADPRRVFSWLICESYDDKGNAIEYTYKREDATGVDVAAAHERHRNHDGGKCRTANRYLKSVRYGNRVSRLAPPGQADQGWLFELVFDYGDHDKDAPTPGDKGSWQCRNDPFSNYRASFEIRTYRLCQRILMFHHFPAEADVGANCLVRSMTLKYRSSRGIETDRQRGHPAGAFLESVTVAGHRRDGSGYLTREMPPLELEYSTATVQEVQELDAASLENLPMGLDDSSYQLVDLDGESIAGVLTEQAGAWFYKPNLGEGHLGPMQTLPTQPSASLGGGYTQLLDLAGDGKLDLVTLGGPVPGFFERTEEGDWAPHRAFASLPALDWSDPNLRFVDCNGDGHADVLITENDAIVVYPSLGEDGYGPAVRVPTGRDEDTGPRLVFADGTQSIYLADFSGDGLTDLARIRNGDVCYWPNLGYGRFGAKVVMDGSPWFDRPELFDHRRLHLTDHDGTGPTDMIHVGGEGVDLYVNQMGNSWSRATRVPAFPPVDDATSISVVDLLGRGTVCLVWSSPLPGDAGRQVRYVDLTGVKPHLLSRVRNNLGVETAVTYAASTAFYLADKAAGWPWVTRLPFPVHVVERVETFDWVSRNRFVTRYTYHHGRFDGVEREFCGFGMVDQWDTEHIAALAGSQVFPAGENEGAAGHVPPVRIRTWFHTGFDLDRTRISTLFAGEYYPPADQPEPDAAAWLLDDTVLDSGLSVPDEREACRALKGRPLRQEVYALDGSDQQDIPYTVVEHNYTVDRLQPADDLRYGVFTVHPRETLTVNCERDPGDARVAHELVLAVDRFGTVTHSVAVAYGRKAPADPPPPERTSRVQATTLVTETRVEMTTLVSTDDAYRTPVPYDTRTYQLTGPGLDSARPRIDPSRLPSPGAGGLPADTARRLVSRQRTRFQADNLTGPLGWGEQGARGLVHETYQLALTPDILTAAFGNRVDSALLTSAGYVELDGAWWMPSGTVSYTPAGDASAAADPLGHASEHFFVPRRFVDPFGALIRPSYATQIEYDDYDLLSVETVDPLGNRVTAGERDSHDARGALRLNYRVLAPVMVTDPNRNRTAVDFDALGLVAATAVMGKPEEDSGDRLDGLTVDLTEAKLAGFWADPISTAPDMLGNATCRFVYDINAYLRTRQQASPDAPGAATISRERHVAVATTLGGPSPLQLHFSYCGGAGSEIQEKLLAEPGPDGAPRWVCSGWVVVNNKGEPVRQYEPFFSPVHTFSFAATAGVSTVLCYDALGRLVATIHPNHTYDKVVIGPWQQAMWDVNDTATTADPTKDLHVGALIGRLPVDEYSPTWYQARITRPSGDAERIAAERSELHAETFTSAHFDPLGRTVLTVFRNSTLGLSNGDPPVNTEHRTYAVLDITGNQLEVLDCSNGKPGLSDGDRARLVARSSYDLAGTRLVAESMEAGTRRQLTDVFGKPVVTWEITDGGDRRFALSYDQLRRPLTVVLGQGARAATIQRTTYGEGAPHAAITNLRGQVWQARDGAGLVTHCYDTLGNLASASRQLARSYRDVLDWSGTVELEPDVRTSRTYFDALSRPTTRIHPDGTVVRYSYNAAGLPDGIAAQLPGEPTETGFITNVDYNPKGQRTFVAYGNGVTSTYTYEPETFRLSSVDTQRAPVSPDGMPVPADARRVQALRYTYDPAGNITHIQDDAQPTVFNHNTKVDASTDYVYDALYRLVVVRGREHLAAGADGRLAATSAADLPRVNPADRRALGRYCERYSYDVAGNLTKLRHTGTDPANPGWTRHFVYQEASQLPQQHAEIYSNRLTRTEVNGRIESYGYDAHGNMTTLPPLQQIGWDHHNQLNLTSMQYATTTKPEITYYTYSGAGQRVRKTTDSAASVRFKERIYLGDFELYREFGSDGQPTLVRTTVHIMDRNERIALVETGAEVTRTTRQDRLIRYQYANHLGSATAELSGDAKCISYEEYYAYGCTALAFACGGAPPKRYRYSMKERDEETGLLYYGIRYYAPWLTRWTTCDPTGLADGPNLYVYARCNPIVLVDPSGAGTKQWELIQQTELRQPVTATAKGRGISPTLRAQYQALGRQWQLGEIDVGHVEPFGTTPAGKTGLTYAQPRGENRSLGASEDKAAVAEARKNGGFARVNDQDLTAKSGTRYGQPDQLPRLKGLENTAKGPAAAKPASPIITDPPIAPTNSGPIPSQSELPLENGLPVKGVPAGGAGPAVNAPSAPAMTVPDSVTPEAVPSTLVKPSGSVSSPIEAGPFAETAAIPGRAAAGRTLSALARSTGSDLVAAGKFGLGTAGLVLSVVQNSPHFWEGYYDTADADLVYALGKALNFFGVGSAPRKPPHQGGDPAEYFRGTKWEGTDWNKVFKTYGDQDQSWFK